MNLRRHALRIVAGGGTALALAACSGGGTTSTTGGAPSAAQSSAAPSSASGPSSAAAQSSAAYGSSGSPASAKPTVTGTLEAQDQSSDGTSLTVAAVSIKGTPGWVAIHKDVDGKPGPVVGTAKVAEGDGKAVKIELDPKAASGAYWPMLHVDDGVVGTYEFPKVAGVDLPVKSGSDVVMKKITLTVK